jgi:glycosyltransferase involved in cell wall biosynthesis
MRFSIVMPTYNRAFIIQRAIKSVIAQTYYDWELIVIDDGSTDNTAEIIRQYSGNRKIKFFQYTINHGVNYARNRGIEVCSGDYVTFLDSDDEFFEDTLIKANDYIKRYKGYEVFCFAAESESGEKTSNLKLPVFTPRYEQILGGVIKGDTLRFIKRSIFDDFKFREDILGFEGITWVSIEKEYSAIYINEVLLRYWQDTISIQRFKELSTDRILNNIKGYEEYITLFEKKYLSNLKIRMEYSKILARIGHYYILAGNYKKGLGETVKSLIAFLFQLRAWRNMLYIPYAILKSFHKGL